MASIFRTESVHANFGGQLLKLSHQSKITKTPMAVHLFLPAAATTSKVPVIFYLSGLTCTPANCSEKGFLQASASRHGIAIVYPDTSPRGANIAGEADSWDFGVGASYYLDATKKPWSENYRMYSYITSELPGALWEQFGDKLDKERVSIMGHSMGGHGALVAALKNPGMFKSVSAFSPISSLTKCKWGAKAIDGFLEKAEEGKEWDAAELLRKNGKGFRALVDQGTKDNFYIDKQLNTELLEEAAKEAGAEVEVRYQKDYDHSYFFVSTFGGEHIDYHAKALKGENN